MSRTWTAFRVLLGAQTLTAVTAAVLELGEGCSACRAGGLSLGLAGALFYGGLLAAALLRGPSTPVYAAAVAATGVHLFLAARMLAGGPLCAVCLLAAGLSLPLGACAVAAAPERLGRVALLLPLAAVPGFVGTLPAPSAASAAVTDASAVRITVFSQADCPYCDVLKHAVLPAISREHGPRVDVVWRDAAELPSIRRTPTVFVSRGGRQAPARVFEGLPTAEMLRDAIRDAEGRP